MILCISWPYTEDGGGSQIVRVLVTAEADDMGSDTLSDVLIYTVQLCGPGNLLILQQIDTYHTSVYNHIYNKYSWEEMQYMYRNYRTHQHCLKYVRVTQVLWVPGI